MEVHIVRRGAVLTAFMAGDVSNLALVNIVDHWLTIACNSKPGKGPLCINCDHEFNRRSLPAACLVSMPFACDKETTAITSGVCDHCNCDDEALYELGFKCAQQIWPNLRTAEARRQ
jgi:hypothetical protein